MHGSRRAKARSPSKVSFREPVRLVLAICAFVDHEPPLSGSDVRSLLQQRAGSPTESSRGSAGSAPVSESSHRARRARGRFSVPVGRGLVICASSGMSVPRVFSTCVRILSTSRSDARLRSVLLSECQDLFFQFCRLAHQYDALLLVAQSTYAWRSRRKAVRACRRGRPPRPTPRRQPPSMARRVPPNISTSQSHRSLCRKGRSSRYPRRARQVRV